MEVENKTSKEKIGEAAKMIQANNLTGALNDLLNIEMSGGADSSESKDIACLRGNIYWHRGEIDLADIYWHEAIEEGVEPDTKASAYAGLGLIAISGGDKEAAIRLVEYCLQSLPDDARPYYLENINRFAVSLSDIEEVDFAEEILKEVVRITERQEKLKDQETASQAKYQRAEAGYNLAMSVYLKQGKEHWGITQIEMHVIPRFKALGTEAAKRLAASYHAVSELYMSLFEHYKSAQGKNTSGNLVKARTYEVASKTVPKAYGDLQSVEKADQNIRKIDEKIGRKPRSKKLKTKR